MKEDRSQKFFCYTLSVFCFLQQELREKNWKAMEALEKAEKSASEKVDKTLKSSRVMNSFQRFSIFRLFLLSHSLIFIVIGNKIGALKFFLHCLLLLY